MSYQAPKITAAGLTIPSYNDIIQFYVSNFLNIYGQTANLDNSSSDFQMMSVIALSASDGMQALQLAVNSRSPATAIGAALDSLVKLNGIARKLATFSTCQVTLTGVAGTEVDNGIVRDVNGNNWALPPVVIISGGTVTVTAVCQTAGAINALIGQITTIQTPTADWTGVTNSTAAALGQPVETDAQLRGRQAISVELPSITILAGTIAAIAGVPGVTRYNVAENNTNATDANGNPAHSITSVVEGGTDTDIAQAIFDNRGIGALTNGTTTVNVTDPNSSITMPIKFSRPVLVPIFVTATVHIPAGSPTTTAQVQAAIVAYLNTLQIGETVTFGALVAAAMLVNVNLSLPTAWIRSLLFAITASPSTTTDVSIAFDHVAQGILADVLVTAV